VMMENGISQYQKMSTKSSLLYSVATY
jgi:hypothetical protein